MTLFDRIQRAFRELVGPPAMPVVKQSEKRSDMANDFASPRSGRPSAALLRSVAEYTPIVRAAINAKKRHAAALRFEVNGPDERVSEFLAELLESPAPGYSWRQWLSEVLEDLLVLDAVCIYLWPTRAGEPYALLPIDAGTIAITPDDRGILPQPPATAYEQRVGGLAESGAKLTVDELVYESMNPRPNSLYGLSPTEVVMHTAMAMLRRMTATVDRLDNSNVPAFFGEVPSGWTTPQISEWQTYWDQMVRDRPHQGVWGPADMNVEFPPRFEVRSEFDEYLIKLVCAVFEIQPQELGFTASVNRATGEVQETITQRRSVRPMAELLIEVVGQAFDKFGYSDYGLVFPELLARDRRDIRDDARVFVPAGIVTPNEIREEMGLDPHPDGDQLRQPVSGQGLRPLPPTDSTEGTEEMDDVERVAAPAVPPSLLRANGVEIEIDTMGPDADEILIALEDAAVARIIDAGLELDLQALLNQIREAVFMEEAIDQALINQVADEIVAAHSELLRPLTSSLIEMAQEGVTAAAFAFQEATNITLDWSLANAEAADWARQYGYELIDDLAEVTRRRLGSEIGAWIEAQEDFEQLVARVAAVVGDEQRARLIASTEATRAFAEGNLFSWRAAADELEITFMKVWRTAADDKVCPLCAPMDGLQAALDGDAWYSPSGGEGVGGVLAPPMHPRCRCWLVTVARL